MQVNWPKPNNNNFGYMYEKVHEEISIRKDILWNKKIPIMIQAYFEDVGLIMRNLLLNAKKDAKFWLVVSTSAYAGIEIPVDLILADIGSNLGWNLEEIIITRYLRHSTQNAIRWLSGDSCSKRLRESIIIFNGHI